MHVWYRVLQSKFQVANCIRVNKQVELELKYLIDAYPMVFCR